LQDRHNGEFKLRDFDYGNHPPKQWEIPCNDPCSVDITDMDILIAECQGLPPPEPPSEEQKEYWLRNGEMLMTDLISYLSMRFGNLKKAMQQLELKDRSPKLFRAYFGYGCDLFDYRVVYECAHCKALNALSDHSPKQEIIGDYYKDVENNKLNLTEEQKTWILSKRGLDVNYQVPSSLKYLFKGSMPRFYWNNLDITNYQEEYNCSRCGNDLYQEAVELIGDQFFEVKPANKTLHFGLQMLDELLKTGYVDGYDELPQESKANLIECDLKIVNNICRALPSVNVNCQTIWELMTN
jgi:DNA-directed RNA polymerase subunit RPC12/RpoP